jgi:serine/threonine protein kinase
MLESTKGDIPEIIIANVFYSVACALEAMHSKGLAHRDIKL